MTETSKGTREVHEQIDLELAKFYFARKINPEIVIQVPSMKVARMYGEDLAISLNAYFGSMEHPDVSTCTETGEIEARVPTSWFQMFKSQYFPDWLLKKYPIVDRIEIYEYDQQVSVSQVKVCPHVNIKFDENRHTHFDWLKHPDPQKGATSGSST